MGSSLPLTHDSPSNLLNFAIQSLTFFFNSNLVMNLSIALINFRIKYPLPTAATIHYIISSVCIFYT